MGICAARSRKQAFVAGIVELCRPLVSATNALRMERQRADELEPARSRLLSGLLEDSPTAYDAWRRMGVLTGRDFPEKAIENVLVGYCGGDESEWPGSSLRGLSYRLAAVEDFMPRSSIDRLVKSGKVVEERNAATFMVGWSSGGKS